MKVIITGGTGFLGRHLVWRAAAEGAEVIFTGRTVQAAEWIIKQAKNPVYWHSLKHGTGCDVLQQISHGANVIIHAAALSSPWGRREDFQKANIDSTTEVLAACRANHIPRLVHISTPSIYFEYRDKLNIQENSVLPPPVNEYVATKWQAEQLIAAADDLSERVILRPRALFGEWDQTLFPRLLKVMATGTFPLIRKGEILLDVTYVENVVEAIWLAATQPLQRELNIYNVTNDDPRYLRDLLSIIAETFSLPLRTKNISWSVMSHLARLQEVSACLRGKEPTFTRYSAGVLAFSQTLNISALKNELGYQAKISVEEGVARHAAWWREQKSC